MTQEHPSTLTFSIEDSVWLNKGQEIEEIIGMSLTPEIAVDQDGEHVTIKGGLRFIGEYRVGQDDEPQGEDSFEALGSFRSVGDMEQVEEDGTGEIEHVFPIDITIPMARIQSVDDIFVEVESFDYDLPEKSCIQLTADVCISGMSAGEEEPYHPANPGQAREEEPEEPLETAFSFEAVQEPVIQETGHSEERQRDDNEEINSPVEYEVAPLEPEATSPQIEPLRAAYEEAGGDDEPVEKEVEKPERRPSFYSSLSAMASRSAKQEEEPSAHLEETSQRAPTTDHRGEADIVEEVEEEQREEPHGIRQENALYLTKMLRNEDEQFSKWRMCIIQGTETLEHVAERYEISTAQLTRMNNLESEHLEEGQILYIPVSTKS
ncbi:stage VI sporulation protein D [Shouchella shacheensis]|uniref:stage VI sporulation protein D n=1 Tax=Shouchella shacheensis TaxID=1649580 RepID=UPI0007403536|nr:stage VI sporulation protein D [Shouchella shacheensis]